MDSNKVVKRTAIGFLVAGPVGAAVGALSSCGGDKKPKDPALQAAELAIERFLLSLFAVVLLGVFIWLGITLYVANNPPEDLVSPGPGIPFRTDLVNVPPEWR